MSDNNRNNQNKNQSYFWQDLTGFHRAVPIILGALAVILFAGFLTKSTDFGAAVSIAFRWLFGSGAYAIPALLFVHAFFYADDLGKGRIKSRIIFSLITVLVVAVVEYGIVHWIDWREFKPDFGDSTAVQGSGGFIGIILAWLLVKLFGPVGVIIIAAAVIAIYIAYFYTGSSSTMKQVLFTVLEYGARFLAIIEKLVVELVEKIKEFIDERKQKQIDDRHAELIDDEFFQTDNGIAVLEIKELGIKETKDPKEIEKQPTLHSKIHIKSAIKNEPPKKEEPAQETPKASSYADSSPNKGLNFDYNFDYLGLGGDADSKEDFTANTEQSEAAPKKTERVSFGLDESAENVFTKDFDPFDFNTAEKIATRMSSKAPIREKIAPIYGEAIDLDYLTEEDVKRIREKEALAKKVAAERAAREQRLREFEARKAAIVQQYKSATTNAQPEQPAVERKSGTYAPTFTDYSNHSAKEDIFTVKENKVIERQAAEIANREKAMSDDQQAETFEFTTVDSTSDIEKDNVEITYTASVEEDKPKLNSEYAKTVAFNVYSEISHNPAESNSVNLTHEKSQRYNDTAAATAAIAEAVASRNPMYARSENVINGSFSYTIKNDPEDEMDNEDDDDDSQNFGGDALIFNNYTPLDDEDIVDEDDEDEYLSVKRDMVNPASVSEYEKEDEDTVKYATASHNYSDSSDISATFEIVDSDNEDSDEDDIKWNPDYAEPIHLVDDDDEDEDDGDIESTDDYTAEDEEFDSEEIPVEEQNPEVIRQREAFTFLKEEDEANDIVPEDDEEEKYVEPTPVSTPVSKPMPPAVIEKKEQKPKVDFSNYKLPHTDFLISPPVMEYDYTEETQEKANRLIEALASFSVTASIKGVDRGPRITRYEVVPARGVKVSSVLNLQDDIALHLAANSIRMEAPIPGKAAIGVEIPNDTSNIVYLKDLIETPDFQNKGSKTAICIGKDVAGTPVFGDIAKMPHLLVAGATGMGKSVCINSFMISLLYKAKPDEVKFIMIDPKKVEFKRYNGIPHLLVPVVTEAKQAAGSLMWAVGEMERRYGLIEALSVSNIDGYNDKVARDPSLGEFLPRIIIVIDEFADLMFTVKDPVEKLVQSLAQKARAAGIHLIIGTQRPSVSVITGTIKANIPSRISCKVASYTDSRTVLEASGAEKLLDRGDMLFSFPGAIKPIRVQGAFVSDGELDDILSYVKGQANGDNYNDEVLNEINRAAAKCGKKSGESDEEGERGNGGGGEGIYNDPQFLDAVDIALSQGQISTALLQRKLSIGFGKAARFIDHMEDIGLVSEKNGAKPRSVLLTREEWVEKFNRISL